MSENPDEEQEEFNLTDASVGIAEQPKTEEAEPVEETPPPESGAILDKWSRLRPGRPAFSVVHAERSIMPKPESQDTMIPIKKVTRERLVEHKMGNDTYDSLINRLLDGWDNANKPSLGTGAEG